MTQKNVPQRPPAFPNPELVKKQKQTQQQNQQEEAKALDAAIDEVTPEKKMTKAEIIDDIVKSLNLFIDQRGDHFADVTLHNQPTFARIDSELFENYIDNEMINRSRQFPGKNLINRDVVDKLYKSYPLLIINCQKCSPLKSLYLRALQ